MLTVTTAAAALALGIEPKVLDNHLARGARELVPRGRRGLARRISLEALEIVAVALLLERDFGTSMARAVDLARAIVHAPHGEVRIGSLAVLTYDVPRLRGVLERAIAEALETVVPPRRGRPRTSEAGRLA